VYPDVSQQVLPLPIQGMVSAFASLFACTAAVVIVDVVIVDVDDSYVCFPGVHCAFSCVTICICYKIVHHHGCYAVLCRSMYVTTQCCNIGVSPISVLTKWTGQAVGLRHNEAANRFITCQLATCAQACLAICLLGIPVLFSPVHYVVCIHAMYAVAVYGLMGLMAIFQDVYIWIAPGYQRLSACCPHAVASKLLCFCSVPDSAGLVTD
jgi:hypothetical protein